ncbi:MBL fold metallo-hydrolase [Pseudochelatococcus contaminans]|uniref:MBL fold metallo-hydrolase n=1 Tax=Pseudochelatococcus contaminans TaxID=1538103 RepID=UPI00161D5B1A|nr:MBL fold metallo-hydrolase [Pseudochelatococcus contaminans]
MSVLTQPLTGSLAQPSQQPTADTLSVRFWGVRGSLPVAGPAYSVFGGRTCCVEIRCGSRLFIVDAGTGIAPFGEFLSGGKCPLDDEPGNVFDLLLSHLHLDHVMGLPFFAPALGCNNIIRVHVGNMGGSCGRKALDRLFSPPLFPVTLDELPAQFNHIGFNAGEMLRFDDGFDVATCPLFHPDGSTAYRFDHGGRRVCYVSDIEHGSDWPPANLIEFVTGSDLVIFDAMYAAEEYARCKGWGHSTCEAGLSLCVAAGVKSMAAFHLHPRHDDERLALYENKLNAVLPGSFVARDGFSISFPAITGRER